jgi:hypothetical protein
MVKFVEQGIPNKWLDSIFQGRFHHGEERLDGLYCQVMNLSFQYATDEELDIYKLVVGVIVLAKTPLHRGDLKYFIGRDEDEASIISILLSLSSIISMGTVDEPTHISHLSFTEFVCDPHRCDERFAIHRDVHNRIMALGCLHIMRTELQFNICQLAMSHVQNLNVLDLAPRIGKFIPACLSYSCRFWPDHLQIEVEAMEVLRDFTLAFSTG